MTVTAFKEELSRQKLSCDMELLQDNPIIYLLKIGKTKDVWIVQVFKIKDILPLKKRLLFFPFCDLDNKEYRLFVRVLTKTDLGVRMVKASYEKIEGSLDELKCRLYQG